MEKGLVTVAAVMALRGTKIGQAVVRADRYFMKMVDRLFWDVTSKACMKYSKTTEGTFKVVKKIAWLAAYIAAKDEE